MPSGRRRAFALLSALVLASQVRAAQPASGTVDVWLDLDLPALATLPKHATREREALRQRIRAQQDDVMARLAALGGRELGRVQLLRNALAVRLPVEHQEAARQLPGVRSLSRVRDTRRDPPRLQR